MISGDATSTNKLPITVAWFERAVVKGKPALGDPETGPWGNISSVFLHRREGEKDGCCFTPCRSTLEPDGYHVRRLKANVIARTLIALDFETNKVTGEIPPALNTVVNTVKAMGLAGIIYSSHNHQPETPRFRVVIPISEEIEPELPVCEVMAERIGLAGVLDHSKLGAASPFYLPSCADEEDQDHHQTVVLPGAAIDAAWIRQVAGALLAEREAEAARIAAEAHAEAAARREAKIAAGFDPDDSLIEKLRVHLDLEQILLAHGYDKSGRKFRHPNSESGGFGADIATFGGIERVFSHNAGDPLHASNLPSWATVTAIDAVDAAIILSYGGDRQKGLTEMARRFGLTKAGERKAIAALIFRLIRQRASQELIESTALAEGNRLGLSAAEVCNVAQWVVAQAQMKEAA
jgi:hypothetical protein